MCKRILIRQLLFVGVLAFSSVACTLTGEQITLTPPPTLPTVEFLFPDNNATVFENADLTIDLLAQDAQGIDRIELFVDALGDGEPYRVLEPAESGATSFRVETNWLAQGVGGHSLTAKAYRTDGTPGDETTIVIEVVQRPTPLPAPN